MEARSLLMGLLLIFPVLIALALAFRLLAGTLDGDRIDAYAESRGWKVRRKGWEPFGPGWLGEKNARIYKLEYEDREGSIREAHVKTSMLSGVYLTNERLVGRSDEVQRLEAENAKLKARLEEQERSASDPAQ